MQVPEQYANAGSIDGGDAGAQNAKFPWLASYPANVNYFATFRPVPLPALLDNAVARFGNRPATQFLGKTLTYAQLGHHVNRAAKGLQAMGIGKGVQVGLLLPNCPSYVVFHYGTLKAGGAVVNFNPLYTIPELSQQAKDAAVDTMVTLDLAATYPKAKALLDAGIVKRIIVVPFREMLPSIKGFLFSILKRKDIASWKPGGKTGVFSSHDVLDNDGQCDTPHIDVDEVAVLQYTGGTTGTPKGAALTHANLSVNVQQIVAWWPESVEGSERFMCVIPFFHVFAMTSLMNHGIARAAQLIMLPRFELNATLKLIRQTKPTFMTGVPTLFNAIANAKDITHGDLASFKFCVSGGAPLPIEVKRNFEKSSGAKLVEGYGLSETAPVTHVNPPNGPIKEGSIGLPLPGTLFSLRELGAPENEVPLGEKGEICIAGPQVMKGYYNKPRETADAFIGPYFRTGDVAYMDSDGFTFIVDRIKDLIICSGFNVYPRRIEEAIYQHPAVEEVTVIGIPDQYRGEAPKAYIKLRAGQTATAEEMLKFLQSQLSKIEMPSQIEFRDELPKTLIGKLSKKELKAEIAQQAAANK